MNIRQSGSYKILRYDPSRHEEVRALYDSGLVDGLDIYPAGGFAEDTLNALIEFKRLKAICIQRLPKLQLDKLAEFQNLEYLIVEDSKDSVDFKQLPHLTFFAGEWHKDLIKNVQHSNLKRLHLWKFKSDRNDMSNFPTFFELEELSLVQSTVTSLNGLSAFKNLKTFEMHYRAS